MSSYSVKSLLYRYRKKQGHDKGIYLLLGEPVTINLPQD